MRRKKVIKLIKEKKIGARSKITLALMSIAAVLLLSSVISIMEFGRMSNYVSDLIAKDINSINEARKLADVANAHNLEILAVIGDEKLTDLPDFDANAFMARCDSLSLAIDPNAIKPLADSVKYSYAAYMLTTLELSDVIKSDFINSRDWYFDRLQPRFNRLTSDIDKLSSAIYVDLKANSETFESGFYRSIVPGMVAVGVGLLLVLMLLFFLMTYYINPIYKMLGGIESYRSVGKKYTVTFDGEDQLQDLNTGVKELVDENQILRKRIASLKNNEHKNNQ